MKIRENVGLLVIVGIGFLFYLSFESPLFNSDVEMSTGNSPSNGRNPIGIIEVPIPEGCSISESSFEDEIARGVFTNVEVKFFDIRMSNVYARKYLRAEHPPGNIVNASNFILGELGSCEPNTTTIFNDHDELLSNLESYLYSNIIQKPIYLVIEEDRAELQYGLPIGRR